MDANPNERPTTKELRNIFDFWDVSIGGSSYGKVEKFGYKRKEIKAAFEEVDKKIPNISTSLWLSINRLEVSNSIQLRGTIDIDDEKFVSFWPLSVLEFSGQSRHMGIWKYQEVFEKIMKQR
ncbi:kinase-like domain-containing protein [Rhizophagus irregularis DAOM 181602=DAOM 197198]|nr:kinase-like domain-containing protein [Rhizophagus irregularis DAOM 181602=DAOM 197198]